ncbi:MAG: alpha/beta fold hydrolase, partial [Pseudomonadota bacterium]
LTRMEAYVHALAEALEPILHQPYAFFGHSMGSLVSFALTRYLRETGQPLPLHFMASAFRAPQAPPAKKIYHLPQEEFIHELRETYDGVPDQLLNEPEILELLLPVVRADLQVLDHYQYSAGDPLACPISVFGGTEDNFVQESQLREWAMQTDAEFQQQMFAGNHYYLNTQTEALLGTIRDALKRHLGTQ